MTTMEDLTKTQIILLTLLISFITSIATGIITTTLLSSAPAGITQTIDRVVEHTIERVTPPTTPSVTTTGTAIHEVTVTSEDNAIVNAADTGTKGVVRIKNPADASGTETFYGLGVIVSKDGLVLSDERNIIAQGVYAGTLADGSNVTLSVIATDEDNHLALFKINPDLKHATFAPIPFASIEVRLGQTVVAIEGSSKSSVAVGRILSLDPSNAIALTDVPLSGETAGGPIVNLSGELVGIKTSKDDLSLIPGSYRTLAPLKRFLQLHV